MSRQQSTNISKEDIKRFFSKAKKSESFRYRINQRKIRITFDIGQYNASPDSFKTLQDNFAKYSTIQLLSDEETFATGTIKLVVDFSNDTLDGIKWIINEFLPNIRQENPEQ